MKDNAETGMDRWIKNKIGVQEEETLTREGIEAYQLAKFVETLNHAKGNCEFYRERLEGIKPDEIKSLDDIEKLLFTTMDDLIENGDDMICVRQKDISRIVTLDTSGTTGKPKRVYFTEEDQELTIDYFDFGMRNLVDETDVILILLPWERPGSVGDLLGKGIKRLGAKPLFYGLLEKNHQDVPEVLELLITEKITSIVGTPKQVLEIAEQSQNLMLETGVKSVLLSTEYIPDSTCKAIEESWCCEVFEHYGMTEMGLGGAVSCWTLEGYHPREADLLIEIIDPITGERVPDGEFGEIVFSTLTRKGMPLIRYRTGDRSRWLMEPCMCGSVLKRLDKVGDRPEEKKR